MTVFHDIDLVTWQHPTSFPPPVNFLPPFPTIPRRCVPIGKLSGWMTSPLTLQSFHQVHPITTTKPYSLSPSLMPSDPVVNSIVNCSLFHSYPLPSECNWYLEKRERGRMEKNYNSLLDKGRFIIVYYSLGVTRNRPHSKVKPLV